MYTRIHTHTLSLSHHWHRCSHRDTHLQAAHRTQSMVAPRLRVLVLRVLYNWPVSSLSEQCCNTALPKCCSVAFSLGCHSLLPTAARCKIPCSKNAEIAETYYASASQAPGCTTRASSRSTQNAVQGHLSHAQTHTARGDPVNKPTMSIFCSACTNSMHLPCTEG